MDDILQQCWQSCVPVQLRLADSEVTTVEQPPVLYFLLPRHSYLLSLLPKALPLLQHMLPPGKDTPWMDHNSLPLKWNMPAGVLFDLLAGDGELPWSLTLHLRSYPSTVLPACDGEPALRGSLLNSLKEAAFICRGSSIRVMEMAPGAQEDLYRSVLNADLQRYRSILGSLQLVPQARSGRQPAVPLRLLVRTAGRGYLSSYEGVAYTSRPVECLRPDGTLVTLREALLPLVAECLGSEPAAATVTATATAGKTAAHTAGAAEGEAEADAANASGAEGSDSAAEAGQGRGENAQGQVEVGGGDERNSMESRSKGATRDDGQQGAESATDVPGLAPTAATARDMEMRLHEVLVCGISPPLDTPLAWLHANMHAPDLFLYAVVHVSN